MKSIGAVLTLGLLSLSGAAFAQSALNKLDMQPNIVPFVSEEPAYGSEQAESPKVAMTHDAPAAPAPLTEAQKSFAALKGFAGAWEGPVAITPAFKGVAMADTHVNLRILSRGNSIAHDMKSATDPDDPAKFDHPLTMFYIDNDELTLTHYCDAGNRPRMVGKVSPDGKTVEFEFRDVSGPTNRGNMYHAVFTKIDDDHHIEDWTYMLPGNKPMHARIELHRVAQPTTTASAR